MRTALQSGGPYAILRQSANKPCKALSFPTLGKYRINKDNAATGLESGKDLILTSQLKHKSIMSTIKVKGSGFFILEIGADKYKGYRPCWAAWSETFTTRKAARKEMANHVNDLNESRRGQIDYVRSTDNSGCHDGTCFMVCNVEQAQSIIDSRFHRSYKASLPWWTSVEESED